MTDLSTLDATGQALQAAVVEGPDDLAAHMALADWLSEQADPRLQARGELIRTQLALEGQSPGPDWRSEQRLRDGAAT